MPFRNIALSTARLRGIWTGWRLRHGHRLKSGTNAWHGSLFEYNRIQALAANSWFSNAVGQQDHLIRNQFGGSVGGPIIKDKTFFYFTTEFHRLRTSSPLTGNTYTSDFAGPGGFVDSGAFAGFIESDPNGICNNQVWLDSVFGAGEVPAAPCPGAFSTTAPYGVAGVGNAALGPVYSSIASAQHPVLCTSTAANCTNLGKSCTRPMDRSGPGCCSHHLSGTHLWHRHDQPERDPESGAICGEDGS